MGSKFPFNEDDTYSLLWPITTDGSEDWGLRSNLDISQTNKWINTKLKFQEICLQMIPAIRSYIIYIYIYILFERFIPQALESGNSSIMGFDILVLSGAFVMKGKRRTLLYNPLLILVCFMLVTCAWLDNYMWSFFQPSLSFFFFFVFCIFFSIIDNFYYFNLLF